MPKLKFRADLKDIVIFLIFCLVLLYLICITVINLNSLAIEGTFKGLNPIPAFSKELIAATILLYVLSIIGCFAACSSYFFEREKGFGITTEKKSKNDGYSKLLDAKDMKKDYGIKKIRLKDEDYDAAGIPFINDGEYAWVDDSGQPHSLIMGASGSGKTQCMMFPLIKILARHGESIIVTDPKGELYEECGKLLQEKGYKIILLNFRDPKEGAAWNPFSYPYRIYKEGNEDKANELLQDLASNILIDPNNKAEPFWEQTASNFFTGLSLGLFDDAPEEEININSINMMAETGEDRIGASTYIKEYFKSKGELSPAYIAAASCVNAPNETRGGIMSTFRTKTRIFSSQKALSEMLSYSDFDIRDIGKEKTAVFLKVHDEKTTYHALATIFVKQAYEALISVAQTCPNLKLPYRTNFILDEFANMPALKDVGTMITASRSRNIRFSFAIQNFSQLNQVYGKDVAETIKGNCGNFVYIMSTELAALEEISKLLGDQKPAEAKKDKPAPPIRPLFTVSDLQSLKENEVVFNRFRSMPFKTKLTPNWKIDWGKKYELMGYEKRADHDVKVFDLKAYVTKMKESQGIPVGPMPGAPMAGGMPMPNPFMPPGMVPGGAKPAGVMPTNLDDYIKQLDEKIAAIEREEAEEKARLEREKNANVAATSAQPVQTTNEFISYAEPVSNEVEKTPEQIEKEISDIFEHKVANTENYMQSNPRVERPQYENRFIQPLPPSLDDDNDYFEVEEDVGIKVPVEVPKEIEEKQFDYIEEMKEIPSEPNNLYTGAQPMTEDIEKPKVNIDVDSVVVNNKSTNDDFFDDFFGSEDE